MIVDESAIVPIYHDAKYPKYSDIAVVYRAGIEAAPFLRYTPDDE